MEMTTLTETLAALKKEGYTEDFNVKADCLLCQEGRFRLYPAEFHIDKVFRFEGESDPDDEAVLYAISSEKYKLKGTLVNSYGIYSDTLTNDLLKKLKTD